MVVLLKCAACLGVYRVSDEEKRICPCCGIRMKVVQRFAANGDRVL